MPFPPPLNSLDPPLDDGRSRLAPRPFRWGSFDPDPAWVLSMGVGGVIIKKLGTGGLPACELNASWLERCDRALAMLELRLADRGMGIDEEWTDPFNDRGGEREKSTGEVP